jgi:hypothetical protein
MTFELSQWVLSVFHLQLDPDFGSSMSLVGVSFVKPGSESDHSFEVACLTILVSLLIRMSGTGNLNSWEDLRHPPQRWSGGVHEFLFRRNKFKCRWLMAVSPYLEIEMGFNQVPVPLVEIWDLHRYHPCCHKYDHEYLFRVSLPKLSFFWIGRLDVNVNLNPSSCNTISKFDTSECSCKQASKCTISLIIRSILWARYRYCGK